MKTAEEFISFNQANVDAFVKSGQILVSGLRDMGKMFAVSAQGSVDEALSTFRAMSTVRSVKEAVDLQAGLARSAMEKAMSHSTQVAESSFKLAEQTMAPIASRVTTAVSSTMSSLRIA